MGKRKKKTPFKKISPFILIVVIIIIMTIVTLKFGFPKENVVAVVNGEDITLKELETKYNRLPQPYRLLLTKEAFLDKLIITKLLLQRATKLNITVSENEIKEELQNFILQFPSKPEFKKFLKKNRISENELIKEIKEQILITKLLNKTIFSKIKITEKQIKSYYSKNKATLNMSFEQAKEQIKRILKAELATHSTRTYIEQLKLRATIEKAERFKRIKTFKKLNETTCKKEGKVIIRLFSTTNCDACNWINKTFNSLAKDYKNNIMVYHWYLDIGDNVITKEVEKGIPKAEIEIFKKYNPKLTVPTYIFGCKYIRIGNGYFTLEKEKQEFKAVIEELI